MKLVLACVLLAAGLGFGAFFEAYLYTSNRLNPVTVVLEATEALAVVVLLSRLRLKAPGWKAPRRLGLILFAVGLALVGYWAVYACFTVFSVGGAHLAYFLDRAHYIDYWRGIPWGGWAALSFVLAFPFMALSDGLKPTTRRFAFMVFLFICGIMAFDTSEMTLQIVKPLAFLSVGGVPVANNIVGLAVSGWLSR